MSSKVLSLIVARDGSKGVKNKNILHLKGKRTFVYSLEYSLQLEKKYKELDTVVSTDSIKIINYCKDNKIKYILRDKELATSKARIEDVIYDACNKYKGYDYVSLLYADIPIRYPEIFYNSISFLENNKDYDAAMSMTEVDCSPEFMFKYNENLLPKNKCTKYRRQDATKYMRHDGHTILFRVKYFMDYIKEDRKQEFLYEPFGKCIKPIVHNKIVMSINRYKDLYLIERYI